MTGHIILIFIADIQFRCMLWRIHFIYHYSIEDFWSSLISCAVLSTNAADFSLVWPFYWDEIGSRLLHVVQNDLTSCIFLNNFTQVMRNHIAWPTEHSTIYCVFIKLLHATLQGAQTCLFIDVYNPDKCLPSLEPPCFATVSFSMHPNTGTISFKADEYSLFEFEEWRLKQVVFR